MTEETSSCCCRKPSSTKTKDETKTKNDKKTVLFVPLDCVGHINSLMSIADSLKHLGHRTVFLFHHPIDCGLKAKGHEVYDCSEEGLVPTNPTAESEQKWDNIVGAMGQLWRSTIMDNFTQTTRVGLGSMMKGIIEHDERVGKKIELIGPDFIVVDHYFIQPAILDSGKPWARVYSASPLALHPKKDRLPPATLGLPTNWLDVTDEKLKSSYLEFDKKVDECKMELYEEFNSHLMKFHNCKPLPLDPISYIYESEHLNVYMYPEELDYTHLSPLKNWIRCDSILRANAKLPSDNEEAEEKENKIVSKFEIPEKLKSLPGKLIFLSMGSLASGDTELMKRLVAILAKSPHKFIVSRGINWQKYDLAENMWGERFLPQLDILPEIDLIITHGGNNTITECFYYGVPGFVVCPIFSDQYDNAQRIEEQKLGKRVDPFHCSEQELLTSIEEVLGDDSIKLRMEAIRERMQRPENKFKAIKLFKELLDRL